MSHPTEDELSEFGALSTADNHLTVLSTARADGTIHSTVVNVGVVDHPSEGRRVLAVLADARSRKVANLRDRHFATLTTKAGWNWATVEGRAETAGPEGTLQLTDAQHRRLLCDVFAASIGGTPDDWLEHVNNMPPDKHVVVLVTPVRTYAGAP